MNNSFPDIYLFNPTCEYAVANQNANWQPKRILQKMENDLSLLPMYFAGTKDVLLVDRLPSPEFMDGLKKLDIDITNYIEKSRFANKVDPVNFPVHKLLPWGWSPVAHKFLSPLKELCSVEFQHSPVFKWVPEHRDISSRKFALGILKELQASIETEYILPAEKTPIICMIREDFGSAIKKWGKVMIKAPWSSSGRGLQPITKTPVHAKVWEKVMGIVNDQGFALAEPLLNKVLDMALLFEIKQGKVKSLGTSYFFTNSKGQYEGNYLNGLPSTLDYRIVTFTNKVIDEIRQPLINAIENSLMAQKYEGVFGVDTLIYADENHNLKINPCLEINVRYTMGLLALQLEKLISKNKKGIFSTYFQPGKTFYDFKTEMEGKHPLMIVDKKIEKGFFAITEARTDSLFGAFIQV